MTSSTLNPPPHTKLAQQETQLPPPDCRIGPVCHFRSHQTRMTFCVSDKTLRYAQAFRK